MIKGEEYRTIAEDLNLARLESKAFYDSLKIGAGIDLNLARLESKVSEASTGNPVISFEFSQIGI